MTFSSGPTFLALLQRTQGGGLAKHAHKSEYVKTNGVLGTMTRSLLAMLDGCAVLGTNRIRDGARAKRHAHTQRSCEDTRVWPLVESADRP